MTAAAAAYTSAGVVIGCDSMAEICGAPTRVRKLHAIGDWRIVGAGDGPVIGALYAGDVVLSADPLRAMRELRQAVRDAAVTVGMLRTGEQGGTFAAVDLVAAHPTHGIWLIGDGRSVQRWERDQGPCAIGDTTAICAAWATMDLLSDRGPAWRLARSLWAVGLVAPFRVGGPYRIVESFDGAWSAEEAA
jgi:hypothetical protein